MPYVTDKNVYTYHNSPKFTFKLGQFFWIWIIPQKNLKVSKHIYIQKVFKKNETPFTFAFSGEEREVAEKFAEAHVDMWDGEGKEVPMCSVGCVIGTHTGPGVVAVAYFEK